MDRVFFEPLIDRWYALALSITEPITIQEEQAYQDMLAKQFDLSQIQAFISSNSGLCKQQEPASRASFSTFKPRCLEPNSESQTNILEKFLANYYLLVKVQKCLLKIVRFYNSSSNGTKIEGLAKGLERERASVLKIFNENGVEEDAHSGEKTLHDVFGIVEKRHQCLKQLYIPERDTLKQRK